MDKSSKKLLEFINTRYASGDEFCLLASSKNGYTISVVSEALGKSENEIKLNVQFLADNGYIKLFTNEDETQKIAFALSHKGIHWKEFHREEIAKYLKDNWIDCVSMLLALAAFILSLISLLTQSAPQ